MLDILITSGKYPDFDKNQLIKANIGIQDGKIAYIGDDEPEAKSIIDASAESYLLDSLTYTCMKKTRRKATSGS